MELSNAALADALKEQTEFSEEEWKAFGINDLELEHFIRSGNSYYQPFDVPEGFLPVVSPNSRQQPGSAGTTGKWAWQRGSPKVVPVPSVMQR